MKQFNTSRRARTIVATAAVGLFASLGGVGYAAGLVHFHHASPNSTQYPPSKVTICHHTHSQTNPFVTITVSEHAVPAHLGHGDTIGPCSEQQAAPATKIHGKAPKQHPDHANRGHHGNKGHGAPTTKPAKGNHGLAKGHSVNHGPNAVHGNSTAQIKGKGHGKGTDHSPTRAHGPGHGQGHGQGHGPDPTHGNSGGGKGNGHKP
jgi:hypothetical protein